MPTTQAPDPTESFDLAATVDPFWVDLRGPQFEETGMRVKLCGPFDPKIEAEFAAWHRTVKPEDPDELEAASRRFMDRMALTAALEFEGVNWRDGPLTIERFPEVIEELGFWFVRQIPERLVEARRSFLPSGNG